MSSNDEAASADDLLRLVSRVERLESFPRTGWQVCGVQHPESVASHSYVVAVIALWMADHLDDDIDTEEVLRIALVHDLAEAMLGDLPRPVKQTLGAAACRSAEDDAIDTLLSSGLKPWRHAHDEYRRASTIEARLVKAADRIQMLAKALQYNVECRGRVDRFFADRSAFDDYGIPLVEAIFDRLFERFDNGDWFAAGFD